MNKIQFLKGFYGRRYFYNQGTVSGYTWSSWSNGQGGASDGTTYLRCTLGTNGTTGAAGWQLNEVIDLTPYTTLTIKYSYSRSNTVGSMRAALYVHTSKTTTTNAGLPTNSGNVECNTGSNQTKTLDVSALNGSYYIQAYLGKSSYYESAIFDITEISLI